MNKVNYRNRKIHAIGVDEMVYLTDEELKHFEEDGDIQIAAVNPLTAQQYQVANGVFVRTTDKKSWILNKSETPSKGDKFFGFGNEAGLKADDFVDSYNIKKYYE